MDSSACEKLASFCSALFGLATAGASMTVTALNGAALTLTLPALVETIRKSQNSSRQIAADLAREVQQNWRMWASQGGKIDEDQIKLATLALSEVLDLINLDPAEIMKAGRNDQTLINLVVANARERLPEDFLGSHAPPRSMFDRKQGDLNALFLRQIVKGALEKLSGTPEAEARLMPWFQAEVFGQLNSISDNLSAIKNDLSAFKGQIVEFPSTLSRQSDVLEEIRTIITQLPSSISSQLPDRDSLVAELATIRQQYQSNVSLLATFLRYMVDQEVPAEQFLPTLWANAERWKSAGDRMSALDRSSNLTPELRRLKQQMDVARGEERIDDVWRLVEEVDQVEQANFDRLNNERLQLENELNARKEDLLRTKEAKRDTAIATFRLGGAAAAIAEIVKLQSPILSERFGALRRVHDEWFVRGRDKGLNLDLQIAIEIAKIEISWTTSEHERGTASNDLGLSLWQLAERDGSAERMEAALGAFKRASEHLERASVRFELGGALMNIGNSLYSLGERRNDGELLEEAVIFYKRALSTFSEDREPSQWALVQNNLGNALWQIGARQIGTDKLTQAVEAYGSALKQRDRESDSIDWASSKASIGNVLTEIGRRESSSDKHEEAVRNYQDALQVATRHQVPLLWATINSNRAATLMMLAHRERGTQRLEEIISMHREVLEERQRDRAPLDWASTNTNLANALFTLSMRSEADSHREEAIYHYRQALDVYSVEQNALRWATLQNNIAVALRVSGQKFSDASLLQQSIDHFLASLTQRTREKVPMEWAATYTNLGVTLRALGLLSNNRELVVQALDALDNALVVFTKERAPLQWASTKNNIGNTILVLAEIDDDADLMSQAVVIFEEVLSVITEEVAPVENEKIVAQLQTVKQELERRQSTL